MPCLELIVFPSHSWALFHPSFAYFSIKHSRNSNCTSQFSQFLMHCVTTLNWNKFALIKRMKYGLTSYNWSTKTKPFLKQLHEAAFLYVLNSLWSLVRWVGARLSSLECQQVNCVENGFLITQTVDTASPFAVFQRRLSNIKCICFLNIITRIWNKKKLTLQHFTFR